jgi:hypothetical protein
MVLLSKENFQLTRISPEPRNEEHARTPRSLGLVGTATALCGFDERNGSISPSTETQGNKIEENNHLQWYNALAL